MTYKFTLFLTFIAPLRVFGASILPNTLHLNEFTLTSYAKSAIALQPMNVTVINSAQIEESAESSLLPILSDNVTGLFVTERGFAGYGVSTGSAGTINIRGIGQGNKVLFLIDGQPQWAGIYGHSLADTYASVDVSRVDVVKGPASLIYGSNAMGGAINIITKRAEKDGTYGRARAAIGSFSTQKFDLSTGMRKGKWQANTAAQINRSNGNRAGSDFWEATEYAQIQFTPSLKYEIGSSLEATQSKANFPGTLQNPLIDMWTQISRYTVGAYIKNHLGFADGGLRVYLNHGNHKISDGYAPDDTPVDSIFHAADHNFGIMFYQTTSPWRDNNITVGASYQHWGGHITNGIRKNEDEVGAYALMQQSFVEQKLSLNAGVRIQHGSSYGNIAIPQAGFIIRPLTDSHVRFSFSKGFRAPNIRELYIGSPANRDLKPEYLYNYELELRKRLINQHLDLCLSIFFIEAKNMIQTAYIDGRPKNMNTGHFRNKGFEFETKYIINRKFSTNIGYSYLYTTSTNLLYAPKNMLNAQITYTNKGVSATLQSHSVWRLNTGADSKQNYSLLNFRIAYGENIAPFVKLDNLTNKHYEIIYGCPMPGTTIISGITIKI
jgi:iron complex outermembrane receptor protein